MLLDGKMGEEAVFVERKKHRQLGQNIGTYSNVLIHINNHRIQLQIPLLQVLKPFAPILPSYNILYYTL